MSQRWVALGGCGAGVLGICWSKAKSTAPAERRAWCPSAGSRWQRHLYSSAQHTATARATCCRKSNKTQAHVRVLPCDVCWHIPAAASGSAFTGGKGLRIFVRAVTESKRSVSRKFPKRFPGGENSQPQREAGCVSHSAALLFPDGRLMQPPGSALAPRSWPGPGARGPIPWGGRGAGPSPRCWLKPWVWQQWDLSVGLGVAAGPGSKPPAPIPEGISPLLGVRRGQRLPPARPDKKQRCRQQLILPAFVPAVPQSWICLAAVNRVLQLPSPLPSRYF